MVSMDSFCDANSEKLRMALKESDMELDSFNFDPKRQRALIGKITF